MYNYEQTIHKNILHNLWRYFVNNKHAKCHPFTTDRQIKFLYLFQVLTLEYYCKLQKLMITFKGKKIPCLFVLLDRERQKEVRFSEVMTTFSSFVKREINMDNRLLVSRNIFSGPPGLKKYI